jgi:NAD(P)-dependent dehydrogenase (short-subunit alcohol dehydrogenase family)
MQSSTQERVDRVALVTGGAMGIGQAIATRLASDGAIVVIGDIDFEAAKRTAEVLTSSGGRASAVHLDVASPASIGTAFESIKDQFGRCDILVNNAGTSKLIPFLDLPLDLWHRTMDVNVTGSLLCAQLAARMMIESGWGRIVNIASISGMAAGTGRTAYGTSKAAVIGLTRQIAIELAPHGITANGVAPGPVDTPLTRSLYTDQSRSAYTRRIPARRFGTAEEMAHAVAFLVSQGAAYITGHVLPVDGGFMAAGMLDDD